MKRKFKNYCKLAMKHNIQSTYALNIIVVILILISVFTKNGLGQVKEPTPDFGFWIVGNSVTPRFGEHWYKSLDELEQNKVDFNCLLQAIAIEPKTKENILAYCEMSSLWLNQAIDSLTAHNCLGKTTDLEFYSKVLIMTNKEMKHVQESLRPIALSVAERIKQDIPKIKQEYNELKLDSDPQWEDIAHLVIDKILIDGKFHRGLTILEREKGFKKYYSEEQKKIPAYFMENGSQYGTFGVNWYRIKGENTTKDVYFFHGGPLKRYEFPLNKLARKKDFVEIFNRIKIDGSLDELTKDEIQIFKDLGWVVNDKLAVPLVNAKSLKVLYDNVLEKTGNEAAEIVFEKFSVIMDSYRQSPYSEFSDGAGDYIQVCYHLLFTGIINELIKLDALPPIPEPTPEYFGVYITIGSFFD